MEKQTYEDILKLLDQIKNVSKPSREHSLAITKLQECKMWFEEHLDQVGQYDLTR